MRKNIGIFKAAFFAALVAAVCMYSYTVLMVAFFGVDELLGPSLLAAVFLAVVTFIVSFVVANTILFFAGSAVNHFTPWVSFSLFTILGAIGGLSVILLVGAILPRFTENALKSSWESFTFFGPYMALGSISSATAWYILIATVRVQSEPIV